MRHPHQRTFQSCLRSCSFLLAGGYFSVWNVLQITRRLLPICSLITTENRWIDWSEIRHWWKILSVAAGSHYAPAASKGTYINSQQPLLFEVLLKIFWFIGDRLWLTTTRHRADNYYKYHRLPRIYSTDRPAGAHPPLPPEWEQEDKRKKFFKEDAIENSFDWVSFVRTRWRHSFTI